MTKDLKINFPDGDTLYLSHEDWERFMRGIDNPQPASEKLKELMRRDSPWTIANHSPQK